jgi:bifunctional DNA-binding transcriptional regulator/antitoxin component of YhaV-PrlF toxin-antitoxin module
MYFKRKRLIRHHFGIHCMGTIVIAIVGIISLSSVFGQDETIDRILALVNGQVITLTDVRITKTFGLYEKGRVSATDDTIEEILKKLIDQKLVIQVTRDDASVNREEIDTFLDNISAEMGNDKFREELDNFGMERNDLGSYAYEWILFDRILSSRFDRAVLVTLEEIQSYYETRYVPDQQAQGLEPKSMLDIFDDIETILRKEKSEKQVEEWLQNLRDKADIQINSAV